MHFTIRDEFIVSIETIHDYTLLYIAGDLNLRFVSILYNVH